MFQAVREFIQQTNGRTIEDYLLFLDEVAKTHEVFESHYRFINRLREVTAHAEALRLHKEYTGVISSFERMTQLPEEITEPPNILADLIHGTQMDDLPDEFTNVLFDTIGLIRMGEGQLNWLEDLHIDEAQRLLDDLVQLHVDGLLQHPRDFIYNTVRSFPDNPNLTDFFASMSRLPRPQILRIQETLLEAIEVYRNYWGKLYATYRRTLQYLDALVKSPDAPAIYRPLTRDIIKLTQDVQAIIQQPTNRAAKDVFVQDRRRLTVKMQAVAQAMLPKGASQEPLRELSSLVRRNQPGLNDIISMKVGGRIAATQVVESAVPEASTMASRFHAAQELIDILADMEQTGTANAMRMSPYSSVVDILDELAVRTVIPGQPLFTLEDFSRLEQALPNPDAVNDLGFSELEVAYFDALHDVVQEVYSRAATDKGVPMVDMLVDQVQYMLKMSQANAQRILYEVPQAHALTDMVLSNAAGAAVLKQIAANVGHEFQDQAMELLDFAQSFAVLRETFEQVLTTEKLPKEIKIALFDTLQRYSRAELDAIDEYQGKHIKDIQIALTEQINTNRQKFKHDQRSSLLRILHDKPELEAEIRPMLDSLHEASVDVRANAVILRELLDPLAENQRAFHYDLETTGLKRQGDTILSIAYMLPSGVAKEFRIKQPETVIPTLEVLRKLYLKPGQNVDDQFVIDMFRREHVLSGTDMKEALTTFIDDVLAAVEQGTVPLRIGHNIVEFDDKFIGQIVRDLGDPELSQKFHQFLNWQSLDTLVELHKKAGYIELDPDQLRAIERIVSDHIVSMRGIDYQGMRKKTFFPQVDAHLMVNAFALSRHEVGESLERGVLAEDLRVLAEEINLALQAVSNENILANQYRVDRAVFEDIWGGEPLHIAQLTTRHMDGISEMASKRVVDTVKVRQYFTVQPQMPEEFASYLLRAAQRITWYRDKVTKPELLTPAITQQIRQIGEIVRRYLLDKGMKNVRAGGMLEIIKLNHRNPQDLYAAAAYIVSYAKATARDLTTIPGLRELAGSEALRMLEFPELVRAHFGFENSDTQAFFDLRLYDDTASSLHSYEQYKHAADDADEKLDLLAQYEQRNAKHQTNSVARVGLVGMQSMLYGKISTAMRLMQKLHDLPRNIDPNSSATARRLYQEAKAEQGRVQTLLEWYNQSRHISLVNQVLNLSPDDLFNHLMKNAHTRMWVGLEMFQRDPQMLKVIEDYLARSAEFKKAGVTIKQVDTGLFLYISAEEFAQRNLSPLAIRDLAAPSIRPAADIPQNLPPEIKDSLRDMEDTLRLLSDGSFSASTGSVMTMQTMDQMLEHMPEEIVKDLVPMQELLDRNMFLGIRFNNSFIGDPYMARTIRSSPSINIVKNYVHTMEAYLEDADVATKLVASVFAPESALGLRSIFKGAAPQEVLRELRAHPEVVVATVVADPKARRGFRMHKIAINNPRDLAVAMEWGAVVLHKSAYSMFHNIVNRTEINNIFMKLLQNWIVDPTKAGMLTSIGLLLRNTVDSFGKNIVTAGEPTAMLAMAEHQMHTFKIYRQYMDDLKGWMEASQRVNTDASKKITFPTGAGFKAYFNDPQNAPREEVFRMIHNFMQQGPSGGMVADQAKALRELNEARQFDVPDRAKFLRRWVEGPAALVWKNPYTRFIMNTNSHIEHVARLAKFTWEMKQGASMSDALLAVIKTHFDYETKTSAQRMLEVFVPFATFTIENIKFWADMAMTKSWMLSLFNDMLTPLLNVDEYSEYELNHNRSLQYKIISGALTLDEESGMTLKLGPSLLDAFNTLLDPIGSVEGRIIAPLRVPLEGLAASLRGEDFDWRRAILENLPYVGPMIQRYWGIDLSLEGRQSQYGSAIKAYLRTDNLLTGVLPGVFGATQRLYYFSYPGSTEVYSTSDFDRYIKFLREGAYPILAEEDREFLESLRDVKVRSPWSKKIYARRSYSRKAYIRRSYSRRAWKPRRVWPKRVWARKTWAKRVYPKRVYARKSYFRGVYVPRSYNDQVFNRVMSRVRGTQFRLPNAMRNPAIAPVIYKRIYSAMGKARFPGRMKQVTSRNLQAKLRQSWHYFK
jgi:hypothetical protein